jgi:hypothetical protein
MMNYGNFPIQGMLVCMPRCLVESCHIHSQRGKIMDRGSFLGADSFPFTWVVRALGLDMRHGSRVEREENRNKLLSNPGTEDALSK